MMGFVSSHLCQRPNGLGGQETSPLHPYIYSGEVHGSRPLAPGAALSLLQHLLLLRRAWRSPAKNPQAPPPRRRAVGALPQLLLSPCWINKEETSSGCMCVEHGGVVRSALDWIFRDLSRREYDSIIRVLVTLPLSDLQRYEYALPLSLSLLESSRLILVIRKKILNYCYVPH